MPQRPRGRSSRKLPLRDSWYLHEDITLSDWTTARHLSSGHPGPVSPNHCHTADRPRRPCWTQLEGEATNQNLHLVTIKRTPSTRVASSIIIPALQTCNETAIQESSHGLRSMAHVLCGLAPSLHGVRLPKQSLSSSLVLLL